MVHAAHHTTLAYLKKKEQLVSRKHVLFILLLMERGLCRGPLPCPQATTGGLVFVQPSLPATLRAGDVFVATHMSHQCATISHYNYMQIANC